MEEHRLSNQSGGAVRPKTILNPRLRRLQSAIGTMFITSSLVWLGLVSIYGGLTQGMLSWPGTWIEPEHLLAREAAGSTASGSLVAPDYYWKESPGPSALDTEPPSLIAAPLQPSKAAPPTLALPPVHILAPSIELDAPIVPIGTKIENGQLVWETAKWAVGHHQGSANPGNWGNVVLSGHIRSPIKKEGNVFNRLPDLQLGELVVLHTEQREYRYRVVERHIAKPQEVEWMASTGEPRLTLITCYPDWIYSHRLVVIAQPEASVPDEEF